MIAYILLFIISLAVLIVASDWFIDASETIGLSFGISPFIIGVTIIAFGTSLPELATSIASVFSGSSEIVIGNVVGSNIANILLVLGITAVIGRGIVLDFDVMDIDMPLLIASAFILFFVVQDFSVSTFEACLLLVGLIVFLMNSLGSSKGDDFFKPKRTFRNYFLLIVGAVFVYLGASYTIKAIEEISVMAGISPEVIALTAVALGTSLPEVVVSISATRKGKHAIAIGNVLGSNIFNTYAVMGISALVGPLKISNGILEFGLPFMIIVTVLFALICISKKISRWEGTMLLLFYVFFIGNLIQRGMIQ